MQDRRPLAVISGMFWVEGFEPLNCKLGSRSVGTL